MSKRRKLDVILGKLTYVEHLLLIQLEAIKAMTAQLEALKVQVERCTTVTQSAVTLLNGLSAQIMALKDDPVALADLATKLQSDVDGLAASVSANTPPVVVPPVVTPPTP